MSEKNLYYLREDVCVDPLVNQWYAWPNLIAPVTYSMYMSKTHFRLMNSFVNNYELHILANQDQAMAGGGEFVDCSAEQVEDIKCLISQFKNEHGDYFKLAAAVKELDALLLGHKNGESIEPLYPKVPDMLKGYVELTMDLYHQPSYRLIESLLYRSEFYRPALQTVALSLLPPKGARPFALSTPRLVTDDNLHIQLPLADDFYDKLFAARITPMTEQQLEALFDGVEVKGGLNYRQLFTTDAPYAVFEPVTEGMRVRYTGHAGLLVENENICVMVDPVIANRAEFNQDEAYSYSELPGKIDYVCLTHNHSDHVNIETLLQLRYRIDTVVVPKNNGGSLADPSLKLMLQQLNFKVMEVEDLEEIPLKDGKILSIPFLGEHGDLNIRSKSAWYFELNGRKIYAGADSANLEPIMYDKLHDITGDLDILAIGMECVGAPYTWLYGALTTNTVSRSIKESRRLNGSGYQQTVNMIEAFSPDRMLIYALGLEPWFGYFMGVDYNDDSEQIIQSGKILEYCADKGIPAQRMCGKKNFKLSTLT